MENENEQLSSAENEEVLSEVENKEVSQAGEADAPKEIEETEEQKNARAIEEDAERKRVKQERAQASIQRRMDELTRQRYEEKARADALQAVIDRGYGQKDQQTNQESGVPQREQYDNYEDYLEAKITYKAEQIAQSKIDQAQKQYKESVNFTQAEQSRQSVEKQFLERRAAVEKTIPDFRDVIEDWEPNLPHSVVDTIIRLQEGPLITYHLAKNPALEEKFRSAPEYMHGVLIGELLAGLKGAPKITAAPPPGKPVSSSKAGSTTEPPSDPELYMAWAKKHMK